MRKNIVIATENSLADRSSIFENEIPDFTDVFVDFTNLSYITSLGEKNGFRGFRKRQHLEAEGK